MAQMGGAVMGDMLAMTKLHNAKLHIAQNGESEELPYLCTCTKVGCSFCNPHGLLLSFMSTYEF